MTTTPLDLTELPHRPPLEALGAGERPARAASLVRLSQMVDSTTSPQRQRADNAARIEAGGWLFDPAVDQFEDLDRSGYDQTVRRPGLEALRAKLSSYDVIVFWKLDRAFRSMKAFLRFLEECEANNVGLVSVKEPAMDTTTPWGRFLAYVLMAIAEIESANISMRVKAATEYLRGEGLWGGGIAPFGWTKELTDDKHVRLVLQPAQAGALAGAIEAYLGGASFAAVCRQLNAADDLPPTLTKSGEPRKNASAWGPWRIRSIFTNPILIGQNKTAAYDDDGLPIARHEPLLDLHTWTRLQEELTSRATTMPARREDESLLQGLLRCSHCRSALWRNGRSYHCPNRYYDKDAHPANGINVPKTEQLVVEALLARLTPERLAECNELLELERRALADPDPAARRRQLIDQALARLEEDRTAGLYDDPAARARFLAQHRKLVAELATLPAPETTPELHTLGALDADFAERWDELDQTRQRTVLGAAIKRIVVSPTDSTKPRAFDPDRLRIVWVDDPDDDDLEELVEDLDTVETAATAA